MFGVSKNKFKEVNFIQQGCIKLIKWDSKTYIVTRKLYFK